MKTPIVPSITDEELASIEALSDYLKDYGCTQQVLSLQEVQGLTDRLRAAERDACRYRWLRDRAGVLPEDCKTIWVLMDGCSMSDLERQETDQAIDTAMEQHP